MWAPQHLLTHPRQHLLWCFIPQSHHFVPSGPGTCSEVSQDTDDEPLAQPLPGSAFIAGLDTESKVGAREKETGVVRGAACHPLRQEADRTQGSLWQEGVTPEAGPRQGQTGTTRQP